jgi:hypothetical protein
MDRRFETVVIVTLRDQLERDGYAIVEGALGERESSALRRAGLRIVEPALASRLDDPHYQYDDDGVTLKHVDWPSDLDDEFARLIAHPAIVSLLNEVVGPDVQLAFGKLVVKQPRKPGYEWHQDLVYLKHTNDQLFAVALQLDDFSDGEGAVRIVPGSHRAGLVPHHPTAGYVSDAKYLSPVVTLALPRGSITVHHSLALHRSPPSGADQVRLRALYFYRASDAHPVARKHLSGRHADLQVSGQPRPARHQPLAWNDVFR